MSDSNYNNFNLSEEFDPDNIDDPIEPLNIPSDRYNRHREESRYESPERRETITGSTTNEHRQSQSERRSETVQNGNSTQSSAESQNQNQPSTSKQQQQKHRSSTAAESRTGGVSQPETHTMQQATLDFSMNLSFFRDGRLTMLIGVILLFAALYFTIANISYFGTGMADQSAISGIGLNDINPESVRNTGGVVGAIIANNFMARWLGVASFILIFYIACIGLACVKAKRFNIPTLTIKSLACTIALSIFAGYISLHFISNFHWGGEHGYYINTMIYGLMGDFGLLIVNLLIVALVAILFLRQLTIALNTLRRKYRQFRISVAEENRRRTERERTNQSTPTESDIQSETQINKLREHPAIAEEPRLSEESKTNPDAYPTLKDEREDQPIEISREEIHQPIIIEEERERQIPSPIPSTRQTRQLEDVAEDVMPSANDSTKSEIHDNELPTDDFQIKDDIEPVPEFRSADLSQTCEPIIINDPAVVSEHLDVSDRSNEIPSLYDTTEPEEELNPYDFPEDQLTEAEQLTENSIEETQQTLPIGSLGTKYDHRAELSRFQMPSLDLLRDLRGKESTLDTEQQEENKQRITQTLATFGISISRIEATIGPTVTLYEIVPAEGVRISKIRNLEDDIARSIAAKGTRIIAPIPGKETVGIEVPNKDPQVVPIRKILGSEEYRDCKMELPMAIGATISNKIYIADLCKMPHLLVAGATGMGKSVGLNAILASLLYKKHPTEVKFVLVDPKQVEFSLYRKIENHYLAKIPGEESAIITDLQKVVPTLNSLCVEMENRYSLLTDASVRQITEYNRKFASRQLSPDRGHNYMPYIVVVVDEFADLIMTVGKEVEQPIARLAQKARAVGIHLILATQRPSTNVITGIIKANFPGRIAFRVFQMVDSRTIIDRPGANQLIGKGDMLFSRDGVIDRVQCALIETEEVEAICEAIGNQVGFPEPYILPEALSETSDIGSGGTTNDVDPLFPEAARYVVTSGTASASSLQTRYTIGYPRARKIMEQLENARIVGPAQGAKPRQVLVDSLALERILEMRNLN